MGNFELDLTSYLFYKFITVVSTIILLYHMYDTWFILFFLPPALISGGVRIQSIISYLIYMLILVQHSRRKVGYSKKISVGHEPAVPN